MLRFFSLDKIPPGFLPEEVSNGWNAYSILKTGKDEWDNFLPLIFRESGGYKLPLASYITVASEAVLGLSGLAVRLPTAVAGLLSVLLTYLVTFEIFRQKKIAVIAAFLLSLSPWHTSFSRWGLLYLFEFLVALIGIIVLIKKTLSLKFLVYGF